MHAPITNAGSARVLEGSIYVITFFVSEVPWPEGYKMDLFKQMRDAESWLEWKAKEYGKTARFVNGVHGLFEPFETDIVPDYDSGKARSGIATKYLSQAGCPLNGYKDWVKKNSGCDQSLVFVIANKEGRGYASPIASGGSDNSPEGAILYHSYNNPLYAGCIIHEILHLFGAVDLYHTCDQSEANDQKMEKMYPKEVMHRPYNPLKELQMSPLTAWLVGLTDKQEDWFKDFL